MHNFVPTSHYSDHTPELLLLDKGKFEIRRETDNYSFSHFTETTNPALALAVQQIQGESYLAAQYITEEDLDEYGRLQRALDKARGDSVEYVVAEKDGEIAGAVRLVTVPDGGSLLDLPAYEKSMHNIYPDFRNLLELSHEKNKQRGVVEVAGLSRRKDASPSVLLDIIREIVQQTVKSRSKELWLVTATSNSYSMIQSRFGVGAIIPIGSCVPVLNDGVATREYLQPSLIDPSGLIESVANSAVTETDSMQKKRLLKTLDFMVDGLNVGAGEVPQNAIELLESMKVGAK